MINLKNPIGIRKKYFKRVITVLLIIILLAAATGLYITSSQTLLYEEREEIMKKTKAVENLEDTLVQVLFRARGYYAFQDPLELDKLYDNLDELKERIEQFKGLPLTEEEKSLQQDLEEFYNHYSNDLLPLAINYVENNDYDALRALAGGGAIVTVNEFLNYTMHFKERADEMRDKNYDNILNKFSNFNMMIAGFAIISILSLIYIIGRMLKGIVIPIEELSEATKSLTVGNKIKLESRNRQDEIGFLSISFQEMSEKIYEKEQELTAQNEELLSQQDELEEQQEKLKRYLIEIENIQKALDKSAMLCVTDANGVIINVNQKFCDITQYSKEELYGNTTRILKSGDHRKEFYDDMWHIIKNGGIWTKEMKNRKKDGSIYWVNATIVPYLDSKGVPYQYILIGVDITKIKEIQQQLKISLEETKKTKEQLEVYNKLNHNLTQTLENEQFINIVFQYLQTLLEFDKGIFWTMPDKKFATKGLTKEIAKTFLNTGLDDILMRVGKEKYFIIKREATPMERGISGEPFYCYDLYTGIFNSYGETLGVFAATRLGRPYEEGEVTEINSLMKQLSLALGQILMYQEVENAKRLNESIINNINEGIQFISAEGNMIQHNQQLEKIIDIEDCKSKEVVHREHWINCFTKNVHDKLQLEAYYEEALQPLFIGSKHMRYAVEEGNETRFIEVYSTTVTNNNEKTGTVFVYRDITKEYEVDQMKSELVSTVSHELRTPLSSVLGFTELLIEKEVKPERQKKYLKTIHKEAQRLTNLINDFLDLQRMESGKQQYSMAPIKLNEIVMDIALQFKHEQRHNVFIIDKANYVNVLADKDRLIQVFTNLISNGIKFSPQGGDITITLKNKDEKLMVSVSDQGMGIPESQLTTLFEKFKRVDNSETKKIGGTGLGLAICKEIVEAHGGDIRIESEEGKGTTVYFTLPLNLQDINDQPVKDSIDEKGEHDSQNNKVMIVEDDASLALLLSEELKSKGITVIHHYNPKSAYKDALKTDLVGIVVDLMLEDEMDGWELIKKLKETEKTKLTPVIVSSALEKSIENIKKYQITEYLVKPYPPDQLTQTILKIIRSHKESGVIAVPDRQTDTVDITKGESGHE
ncbi:ATP-binding protein [Serpentinicella sp. ANB-PHB4]|uniref:ATP-binding protein n=1 Tax=Serpentinicella sp. ANB-PHB4 TaxID=3074076 RepID=UPI00286517AA|nr:ATP-binding protein [Serpentinicella sp. ANB-PHB4]MDR5659067.1 ATP-binding protein [Serpentinicella sp. ANB-PHB4]